MKSPIIISRLQFHNYVRTTVEGKRVDGVIEIDTDVTL